MMNQHEFDIVVKPAEDSQLDLLEEVFSPGNLTYPQHRRFEVQRKGEGVFLIAWHNNHPIGHFLLRWSGPEDPRVTQYIDVTHSAFLEGGLTKEGYRKKGVATAVIREAEKLASERGCTHIGLEVSSKDNPEARRLYEHLGYIDWGYGEFQISWEYHDKHGTSTRSDIVIFMQKPIVY
ncbi:GNAT family N-acetyltransferase [Paenibacillus cellulositrophicus]|uniref:GNAT family N-acetyltransferase n=1 Tax=Paenibacillus cellulositrophicus TaxID=562959 RepID=UPI003F7D4D6F